MIKSVEFAKKNGLYVSVNGEDASRADKEFLVRFIEEAKKGRYETVQELILNYEEFVLDVS